MAKMRVYKYVEGSVEITENNQQKAIEKVHNCDLSKSLPPKYFTYKADALEFYNDVINCSHLQAASSYWSKETYVYKFDVVRLQEVYFDCEDVELALYKYDILDIALNNLRPIEWGEEWLFVSKERE